MIGSPIRENNVELRLHEPPGLLPGGFFDPQEEFSSMSAQDHLCLRCSRHMQTCCQTAEVFVTRGDVRRIERHTGCDDFHEFRRPENPIYVPDGSDPAWQDGAFQPDGSRRVLRKQANGDCAFLGEGGCTLPGNVRPLVCRIYPYDYDANGLLEDLAPGCPLDLVRPGRGLIGELGMNRDEAEQWRWQLYQELASEAEHSSKTDLQTVGRM